MSGRWHRNNESGSSIWIIIKLAKLIHAFNLNNKGTQNQALGYTTRKRLLNIHHQLNFWANLTEFIFPIILINLLIWRLMLKCLKLNLKVYMNCIHFNLLTKTMVMPKQPSSAPSLLIKKCPRWIPHEVIFVVLIQNVAAMIKYENELLVFPFWVCMYGHKRHTVKLQHSKTDFTTIFMTFCTFPAAETV